MDEILEILKVRLGIKSDARDLVLKSIIAGVIEELEHECGITLDLTRTDVKMFIVDFADWRYSSRGEMGGMPDHLRFRLHNLDVSEGGRP